MVRGYYMVNNSSDIRVNVVDIIIPINHIIVGI